MATPIRNMRVSDELWNALRERAEQEKVTITDLVIRFCQQGLEQSVITPVHTDSKDSKDSCIDTRIDRAIEPLRQAVQALQLEVEILRDSKPATRATTRATTGATAIASQEHISTCPHCHTKQSPKIGGYRTLQDGSRKIRYTCRNCGKGWSEAIPLSDSLSPLEPQQAAIQPFET